MVAAALPARATVEDFLYHESALLDSWRLDEWIELFDEGATYRVPASDAPDSDPETSLFLVSDNWARLQARVKRLNSRNAHVENPRSRTRRIIGNVRVSPGPEPDTVCVDANFAVYRIRYEINDIYVGSYRHVLSWDGNQLRFRHRKAVLDHDALRPSGKVSFIL